MTTPPAFYFECSQLKAILSDVACKLYREQRQQARIQSKCYKCVQYEQQQQVRIAATDYHDKVKRESRPVVVRASRPAVDFVQWYRRR